MNLINICDDYAFHLFLVISWTLAFILILHLGSRKSITGPRSTFDSISVVVVGCGLPKKSMGWYHVDQLQKMTTSNANVVSIVEPYFVSLGDKAPRSWLNFVSSNPQITFVESVSDLPPFPPTTLCLIATRARDSPAMFEACLDNGAKCIFLEKPGAESVSALRRMRELAKARTIPCRIFVGYNKNVTEYVKKTLKEGKNGHIEFVHNNSYAIEELGECFERNSEGMLKNMAIHELALLVNFFGIRVDTLKSIEVDKENSIQLKIGKITDFSKVRFTMTSLAGISATVTADRCGGNVSHGIVRNPATMEEIRRFSMPASEQEESQIAYKCLHDPEMMPYFFVNSDDYWTLKMKVIKAFRGDFVENDVASIDVAIEALRLAEYATSVISKQL